MKTVLFAVRDTVNQQRKNELILDLANWKEVKAVGWLKPEAAGRVGNMAYMNLRDGSEPATIIARLQQMPEVEYAEEPARRHLLDSSRCS